MTDAELVTGTPFEFTLDRARPNPFTGTTTIGYTLARRARVTLRIFDVGGPLVRVLESGERPPGRYQAVWNGLDDSGSRVGSGVFFCQFDAGMFRATQHISLQ
jgi:flagellar hook capping protein FlgD